MPTNEEGEFELVLGNKQLLSVFFIVVLLLFVFFAMGYMVGRNTTSSAPEIASTKSPSPSEPSSTAPPLAAAERPTPAPVAAETKSPEPPTATASPAETAKPGISDNASAATADAPKPEVPKPAAAAAAKTDPQRVERPVPPPVSGATYLQVSATNRKEAELMAEVLSKKGFPAITTPVPDQTLYRVMVGPVRDADIAKTRDALAAAGFKSVIPRKL